MADNRLLPQHVFKSLHISNHEKYNIYLLGSRLWGTNTHDSDWDLLIIGDIPSKLPSTMHKSQYDIKLLDRETFQQRIEEGSLIEVICALLRQEDMLQYAFGLGKISIRTEAIQNWLNSRELRDFEKAAKFWQKGNRQAGWKILRHLLQARSIFNYLAVILREQPVTLTIHDIQRVVRPATALCDKTWMQFEWIDVHAAVNDALNTL